MNKVTNFYKQSIAMLTGDQNKLIALKNERRSKAQLKNQLSLLDLEISKQEDLVEQAEERLTKAKIPSTLIDDGDAYLLSITRAYENLESVRERLEELEKTQRFWDSLQTEFDTEVDVES